MADELRTTRAGHEVPLGVLGITDADVAEAVEDALVSQDAIGDDQLL
jgi:hypothetical protein